jgi:hypothetical protein
LDEIRSSHNLFSTAGTGDKLGFIATPRKQTAVAVLPVKSPASPHP